MLCQSFTFFWRAAIFTCARAKFLTVYVGLLVQINLLYFLVVFRNCRPFPSFTFQDVYQKCCCIYYSVGHKITSVVILVHYCTSNKNNLLLFTLHFSVVMHLFPMYTKKYIFQNVQSKYFSSTVQI